MPGFFQHESKEERSLVLLSFFTLFGILAGHTLLETARDALFVTRVSPTHLPFVYIAIALIGVLTSRLTGLGSGAVRYYTITAALLVASFVDVVFWLFLYKRDGFVVYAFYVWTGLFASWIVTSFWVALTPAVTITQAKRLYGPIGAGALFGAVAGSGTARLLLLTPGLRKLILVSAAISIWTAVGPAMMFGRHVAKTVAAVKPPRRERAREAMRATLESRYVLKVLGLVLLATSIGTFADYVLKNEVAAHIAKVKIGPFFAEFAFFTNIGALCLQLFFLDRLLRWAGVHRALAVIPLLFIAFSTAGLAIPALIAAVLVKGTDASLRTSLLKTGTELFLFPVDERLRPRAKFAVDLFGQRFGQALASVAILGVVAAHASTTALFVTIGVLAVAWFALLPTLRSGYLACFRSNLESGELALDFDLPPPDLESLEALILALNSSRDAEVLTALDLLEQQRKTKLVPSLILFHPSQPVVTRALDILEADGRKDLTPILTRLRTHPEPKVRAAAVRVLATLEAPDDLIQKFLDDKESRVRATAAVALARRGLFDDAKLEALVANDDPKEQHALQTSLLRAIRRQPDPRFVPLVRKLATTKDRGVMVELARTMGVLRDPEFIEALISYLAFGDPREPARQALVRYGEPAAKALIDAMTDPKTAYIVRRQIPRTLAGFDPALAAGPLTARLAEEKDLAMARNLLRALAHLQKRRPSAVRNRRFYAKLLRDRFMMLHHYRAWHASLEIDSEAHAEHQTSARELLTGLLHEKERILEEHAFTLVALIDEKEDYDAILRGLRDSNQKSRAASLELLENVAPSAVRDEVLTIAHGTHPTRPPSVESTLRALLDEPSETLTALAVYHAEELGFEGFVAPPNSMRLGVDAHA